eukprot:gene15891-18844_t
MAEGVASLVAGTDAVGEERASEDRGVVFLGWAAKAGGGMDSEEVSVVEREGAEATSRNKAVVKGAAEGSAEEVAAEVERAMAAGATRGWGRGSEEEEVEVGGVEEAAAMEATAGSQGGATRKMVHSPPTAILGH